MRGLIGGLVLVAGVGGLGWYATQGPAVAMQDEIANAAAAVAETAQHDVFATVSGRDITVTGTVEDAAEQDALFAAFDAVAGRRVVSIEGLSVLPVVSPYVADVTVGEDGISVTGFAPSAQAKADLGYAGLEVANGEPNPAWGDAIAVAARAAETLQNGTISIADTNVSVTGQVADPTSLAALEAALAEMPDGYTASQDIILEDDGTPLRLNLAYDGNALTGSGKIPADLPLANIAIAGASGTLEIDEAVVPSADGAWPKFATAALGAMGALVSGDLALEDKALTLRGVGTPDGIAAAEAALADLPDGYSAITDIAIYDDGTPLRLMLEFDGTTVTGGGKIPADLDATSVAIADASGDLDLQEADIASDDGLWPGFATSALSALGALNEGQMALEGRSVILNGVGTPDGIAAAEAALADVPEGYLAMTDFTLFDDGTPFRLTVEKTESGVTATGKVPVDFADAPDGVEVAFIADETGAWPAIGQAGLEALNALETGTLTIEGETLALSGVAFSAAEQRAALTALGDFGGATEADLAISEAGQPKPFVVTFDAGQGATVSGSFPDGVTREDVADALGVIVSEGDLHEIALDTDADVLGPLASVRPFLQELQSFSAIETGEQSTFEAIAAPGVDAAALTPTLQGAIGDTIALTVSAPSELPANGTQRRNIFTGTAEVFTGGYWLPTFDFFPTPESCAAQSAAVLERDQVQFLSGSAELDVQSIRAINALSSLAMKCAIEGGVFVQVAGHTDNTGDPEANLALSQARADAVREAMLARGLARVVVTATGYGDTQPVADNETDEGRAANRRTEFNWNFE